MASNFKGCSAAVLGEIATPAFNQNNDKTAI